MTWGAHLLRLLGMFGTSWLALHRHTLGAVTLFFPGLRRRHDL
jgi:hypothetical protein